jgi:hypothetical protein
MIRDYSFKQTEGNISHGEVLTDSVLVLNTHNEFVQLYSMIVTQPVLT